MSKMFGFDSFKDYCSSSMNKIKRNNKNTEDKDIFLLFMLHLNSHKNFEIVCRAVDIPENRYQIKNFRVDITVNGK